MSKKKKRKAKLRPENPSVAAPAGDKPAETKLDPFAVAARRAATAARISAAPAESPTVDGIAHHSASTPTRSVSSIGP